MSIHTLYINKHIYGNFISIAAILQSISILSYALRRVSIYRHTNGINVLDVN